MTDPVKPDPASVDLCKICVIVLLALMGIDHAATLV